MTGATAGPAVLSQLTVTADSAGRRLARVPVPGVNLHRALRAVSTGGLSPGGRRRGLLTHAAARRR